MKCEKWRWMRVGCTEKEAGGSHAENSRVSSRSTLAFDSKSKAREGGQHGRTLFLNKPDRHLGMSKVIGPRN
jgi:hypothetical protein